MKKKHENDEKKEREETKREERKGGGKRYQKRIKTRRYDIAMKKNKNRKNAHRILKAILIYFWPKELGTGCAP